MKKRLLAFLTAFMLATTAFGGFAFGAETESGGYINVIPTEQTVCIAGNLGERQNNRFLTFFVSAEKSLETAEYVGYSEVGYLGGFSAELPLENSYDYLTISSGEKTYSVPLYAKSSINLATDEITTEDTSGKLFPEIGESYGAISGENTKERFLSHKAELPKEMSVVKSEPVRRGEYCFFVATDGSDSAEGTEEAPFATLKRALNSLGALSAEQRKKGVSIYLKSGVYTNEDPFVMTFNHKGAEEAPVYISSYGDGEVVLEKGTKISGTSFRPVNDEEAQRIRQENRSNVYVADLSALGITEYGDVISQYNSPDLFENGEKMHIARYPDTKTFAPELPVVKHGRAGELYPGEKFEITQGVEFAFSDERPLSWQNNGDIAIYGGIGMDWYPVSITVDKIGYNETAGAYTVSSNDNPGEGVVAPSERTWAAPTWYYWYNVLEECDSEGEWYLDRSTGKLYVYTQGDISEKNYTWCLGGGSILEMYYSENIVVNGVTFRGSGDSGVLIDGCKKVKIQNCKIEGNSTYGVYILGNSEAYGNSKECGVVDSLILNNGYGGVVIKGGDKEYKALTPCRNYVQNCYVAKNIDDRKGKYPGISLEKAVGCVVSHNLLQGFSSNAIGAGGAENVVEYNELVNTTKTVDDMGSIYWSGYGTFGNHIRYNYLHDPYSLDKKTKGEASAFFADELGSNAYVYGNLADGYACGMKSNGGQNLTFFGNVVMNSQYSKESDTYPAYFSDSQNFFDTDNGVWLRNVWSENFKTTSTDSGFGEYFSGLMDTDAEPMQSRYPEIKEYTDMLDSYVSETKSAGKSDWNGKWSSKKNNVLDIFGIKEDGQKQWEGTGSQIYNEAKLRAPSGHVISNNVVLNNGTSVAVPYLNSYYTERILDCENSPNLITTVDPGFADYQNGDYAISASAVSSLSEFEDIPFEKMGLKSETANFEANGSINIISPKNNSAEDISSEALFQWQKAWYVSYYHLVVSENDDLSAPVVDEKLEEALYRTDKLENGKKYYWRVEGISEAAQYKTKSFSSGINVFYGAADGEVDFAEFETNEDKVSFSVVNATENDLSLDVYFAQSEDSVLKSTEKKSVGAKKHSMTEKVEFGGVQKEKKGFLYLWDSFLKPYAKKEF